MIYAVLFEDDPAQTHKRTEHMSAHLAFLAANSAAVQSAGPLKDAESGAAAGGLWIVSAESPAAVRALVEADPFWPTGLRKAVRILEWTQVFGAP